MKNKKKLVIITGAAGGVGRFLVETYNKKGFQVVGIDLNYGMLLKLKARFDDFFPKRCDLTEKEEFGKILKEIVTEIGTPDIWINNAGAVQLEKYEQDSLERFNKVMDVNFNSIVNNTPLIMKSMRNRGVIVNIASMAGILPLGGMTSYVASKHALVGFTRSLQQELRVNKSGVNLVLVLPGFINTPLIKSGE